MYVGWCVDVWVWVYVCVRSEMCTWSCDATACSTFLTEESSGMEMDHMVTLTMVPDALALEKGIGWVWLPTDLPPLGRGFLNCTICTLCDDHVPHCLFIALLICLWVCLLALPVSSSLPCLWSSLYFSSCTFVWLGFCFMAWLLDTFPYGLF